MLASLRPLMLRQPASLNGEHGEYGALDVTARARMAGAHHIQASLSDLLPGYPPQWRGLDEWQVLVAAFVARKIEEGAENTWYEPWAEPDRHAPREWESIGGFPSFWRLTFEQLRHVDPHGVIVGPDWSRWSRQDFRSMLEWMRDSETLPDVISWREEGSPTDLELHVTECRALLNEIGIEDRPIALTEYAAARPLTPATLVRYLAAIERARVAYAALAAGGDDLGALERLVDSGVPRGTYWVWRWYVELRGALTLATSSRTDGTSALVCVERDFPRVRVLLTGASPRLRLEGVGELMALARNQRVHARAELAPYASGATVPAAEIVYDDEAPLDEGAVVLDLRQEQTDATLVTITPWSAAHASRRSAGRR